MGLKILHSADWHLDSPFAGCDDSQRALLKQEQQSIPGKISQLCRREKCDLLLLAGDIFDGEPARETVDVLKKALSECGARVFITPGNHDFCAPGSLWLEERWPENVYVFTRGLEAVTIPELNCRVYGAGYQSMDSAPLLENFRAEGSEKYCIAVLHGDPTRKDSPYCPITAQQVRDSGLQYLALGHIHSPQHVGRETVRYCGTPLKYSFSEAGQEKSVTVVELKEKGDVSISTIPLRPLRDLRKIKGTYLEVTSRDFYAQTNTSDYLQITLTDEEDILDGLQKLRIIYPNLMQLEYDNQRTRENQEILQVQAMEEKTELELFEEFYQLQNNQPMSEEQKEFTGRLIQKLKEEGQ